MQHVIKTFRKSDNEFIGFSVICNDGVNDIIITIPSKATLSIDEFNAEYRTESNLGHRQNLAQIKDMSLGEPFYTIDDKQIPFYIVEDSYDVDSNSFVVRAEYENDKFEQSTYRMRLNANIVVRIIKPYITLNLT